MFKILVTGVLAIAYFQIKLPTLFNIFGMTDLIVTVILIPKSAKSDVLDFYTTVFTYLHKKKYNGLRSCDSAGYSIAPSLSIHPLIWIKYVMRQCFTLLDLWVCRISIKKRHYFRALQNNDFHSI